MPSIRCEANNLHCTLALVGTIEELSQNSRTRSLVRDQFETNFFSPVNVIKAALPLMREKKSGHVIIITGISEYFQDPLEEHMNLIK